eukprot:UN26369
MLIFGTATAVTAKTMFQTCAEGNDGDVEFNRPWMQTMLMFMAMAAALVTHYIMKFFKEPEPTSEYDMLPGNIQNDKNDGNDWKVYGLIGIPAFFDLVATTLSGIGLLWVDASVYQMLRGSLMIFSAILSIVFLGRKLKPYHWIGISITSVAIFT